MTIAPERTATAVDNVRDLIPTETFDRLTRYLMKENSFDRAHAERVMEQTLVFLVAVANNESGLLFSPSQYVDPGWHAFVLHTQDYAEFCDRVADRFIHHRPMEPEVITSGEALRNTIPALQSTGYPVDMGLWEGPVSCGPCCEP